MKLQTSSAILPHFYSVLGLIFPSFMHLIVTVLTAFSFLIKVSKVSLFFNYLSLDVLFILYFWVSENMLPHLLFSWGSSECLFWNMTSCFPRGVSYFIWHSELRKSQACPLPGSRWVLRNRFVVNSRTEILQATVTITAHSHLLTV